MQERDFLKGSLTLARCSVCLGTWFQAGELQYALQDLAAHVVLVPEDSPISRCICPNCDQEMLAFPYPATDAEISLCLGCEGTWLEKGAFVKLRMQRKAAKRTVGLRSKLLGGFFNRKKGRA